MKATLIKKTEYRVTSFETTCVGTIERKLVKSVTLAPKVLTLGNHTEQYTLNVNIDLNDFTDMLDNPIIGATFNIDLDFQFIPPHSTIPRTSVQVFVLCDEETGEYLEDPVQAALNVVYEMYKDAPSPCL